jgi:hypothetical protein
MVGYTIYKLRFLREKFGEKKQGSPLEIVRKEIVKKRGFWKGNDLPQLNNLPLILFQ